MIKLVKCVFTVLFLLGATQQLAHADDTANSIATLVLEKVNVGESISEKINEINKLLSDSFAQNYSVRIPLGEFSEFSRIFAAAIIKEMNQPMTKHLEGLIVENFDKTERKRILALVSNQAQDSESSVFQKFESKKDPIRQEMRRKGTELGSKYGAEIMQNLPKYPEVNASLAALLKKYNIQL